MNGSKLLTVISMLSAFASHAAELGTCRNPAGYAYYHYVGALDKSKAGWTEDKITGAAFTLTQDTDGSFDVVYVDTRQKPTSSKQEGAAIVALNKGVDTVTVLVAYQGTGTDLYSFFRQSDGLYRFTLMQSRTGAAAALPKSAVLAGECGTMNFTLLR